MPASAPSAQVQGRYDGDEIGHIWLGTSGREKFLWQCRRLIAIMYAKVTLAEKRMMDYGRSVGKNADTQKETSYWD